MLWFGTKDLGKPEPKEPETIVESDLPHPGTAAIVKKPTVDRE
jgi:hypothetical protein